jgi:hypothetical protein
MNKIRGLWAGSLVVAGLLASPAQAILITEFTGDDIEMSVTFADTVGGVTITAAITPTSTETGDIRALWLGLDDSLFDAAQILASHITVSAPNFVLVNPASIDLGGGDNLTGASGIFFNFDLDFAIQQALNPDQSLTSLIVSISTPNLLASFFDEAGARIRSSTGDDGSSKLIGGSVTQVPEPATLSLLGMGLLAVGFGRYRRRRVA